jgi:hypothetical protein
MSIKDEAGAVVQATAEAAASLYAAFMETPAQVNGATVFFTPDQAFELTKTVIWEALRDRGLT